MNNDMMKLLMVNQHAPGQMMNAFLAFRNDMVGMVGAKNLAEAHAAEVTKAEESQAALSKLDKTHKAFSENVARVVFEMPPETKIGEKERARLVDYLEKLANMPVDERKKMFGDKARNAILGTPEG